MASISDRRKSIRHNVSEKSVAVTPSGVCELIDISSGGMLLADKGSIETPKEFFLAILTSNGAFHELDVPVKLVWEKRFPHSVFSFFTMKKIGVKFNSISAEQQLRLDTFINQNSRGRAE